MRLYKTVLLVRIRIYLYVQVVPPEEMDTYQPDRDGSEFSMGSDSNDDDDGYPPGSRRFHRRRSSVRAMVDEEDSMCVESAEERDYGQIGRC